MDNAYKKLPAAFTMVAFGSLGVELAIVAFEAWVPVAAGEIGVSSTVMGTGIIPSRNDSFRDSLNKWFF